jgi:Holliday junction resolvasome RuvABC DNA-binding subunit
MIDEADVQREFLHGPLTFRGAVIALQKMGYDPKEADRMVSEWADDGERMDSDYAEQMGGY